MSSAPAIQTEQLRKVFGDYAAVKGLTLQVEQGEVFGFLGPNGAGKTTSIKMLLGLVKPSSGEAFLLGHPIGTRAMMAQVGFLPEHFRFQEWLTGREFLRLNGHLLGMSEAVLNARMDELLERVSMTDYQQKLLRTYSKGMLQRIGLAQALLNKPLLVFLDEPTSGLDPVGRRLVRDVIREIRSQGTAVFLNSHLLSEIEVTCNRVAFIQHGEVVRILDLSSLEPGGTSVTIRAANVSAEVLAGLAEWGTDVRMDGEQITLLVPDETCLPAITDYLVGHKARVYSIVPDRKSLEDIFIETVGRDGGL